MKKLLFSLALLCAPFLFGGAAQAQVPCVGVGTVVNVPQFGVNCQQIPAINTFAASGIALAPAASATDLVCIAGKAGTVLRVQKITVSGSAATAVNLPLQITKNAVADTAGTQNTGTALPVNYSLDPNVAATVSIATWQSNTTNPTINDTAPGIIDVQQTNFPLTGTDTNHAASIFDWSSTLLSMQPTLRSVAQQICVNLNAVTVTTGKINISYKWTESAQ